ncbi:MAG: chemotaxis protein CheB [Candidatus Promineifilaceae bacterium]|nr:chemotaxis protein CheB [Candidatus Promineifilaceae bacterium]
MAAEEKPANEPDQSAKEQVQKEKEQKEDAAADAAREPRPDLQKPSLPVVAVCASAGGLEAFQEFFRHMPAHGDMAFVVVQHLAPESESHLPELLARHTEMPVSFISDGQRVQANTVHVLPPDAELGIMHGSLQLMDPIRPDGHDLTIDVFLRSLADDQRERAICLILSGTGTDGTLGLKAIKEHGGLALVQDPDTAEYPGMPRSAAETGLADAVLPLAEMPQRLLAYEQRAVPPPAPAAPAFPTDRLNKVFLLLRSQTGHDFAQYKKKTLQRRLERRMTITQVPDVDAYVTLLQRDPDEVEKLFREFLIGVTQFFREPEAYAALKDEALPALFVDRAGDEPLRAWVPACATGEEAYSLAILLEECKEAFESTHTIQIFATDIDDHAIEQARRGRFPASIAADVSPERLQRFFVQEDHTYRVKEEIRKSVIFAEQNLLQDPPFSNLDLISCRNLFIYIDTESQKNTLAMFHYALEEEGILFLGPSENVAGLTDLFVPVNDKWRIFRRAPGKTPLWRRQAFLSRPRPETGQREAKTETAPDRAPHRAERTLIEEMLLDHFAPAAVLIDDNYDIHYTHGPIDRYLKVAAGEPRLNVLEMAREGLKAALITTVTGARDDQETVSQDGVTVQTNGESEVIDVIARPVATARPGHVLLVFDRITPQPKTAPPAEGAGEEEKPRVEALRRELSATRQRLQSTIQELQISNEELRSTNEELQSSNEELQSTNEELETSREELQSVNEELNTVNSELQERNQALIKANNDLNNLLRGTEIATLFLDNHLNIRRFTPSTTEIVNLIDADTGRPLKHIASNLRDADLVEEAEYVLETLNTVEKEVQTDDGHWFNMRILPYRTARNAIEGLVLTFAEITDQKETEAELRAERALARGIVNAVDASLLVLDEAFRVVSANHSFYESFYTDAGATVGKTLYELGNGQWDFPELRELLQEVVDGPAGETVTYDLEHDFPHIGRRTVHLEARLLEVDDESQMILLTIEDVSDR